MATIDIKTAEGKKASTAELADSVFGIEPNVPVMHQVVRMQRASWRAGTHQTKTRGMVSGGGKKPFRQKGTGRARQGTIRAPHWRGGGVVFGPHPRSYAFKVNKKEIKLAIRSALSAKLADGQLIVVDKFDFEKPCTKDAVAVLKALEVEGRCTIVVNDENVNAFLSFRNIPTVDIRQQVPHLRGRGAAQTRGGDGVMKDARDIIIRPIITEHSYDMIEMNKYTFELARDANKIEIAKAVEELFGVTVKKVNTLNVKPKVKRVRYVPGKTRQWKKAMVTIAEGETIEIFAS